MTMEYSKGYSQVPNKRVYSLNSFNALAKNILTLDWGDEQKSHENLAKIMNIKKKGQSSDHA